jgi:hypothetical protein
MAALGRGGRVVETRNRPARARHSEEDKAGIEAGEILIATSECVNGHGPVFGSCVRLRMSGEAESGSAGTQPDKE